jgi:hypothetical protein
MNKLFLSLTTVVLLLLSGVVFSQTANLGILTSFEAFTASGDITNGGGTVTGDVGSHVGTNIGFISPPYTGNTYSANAATAQARFDLLRLYIHLNDLFVDFPNALAPITSPAHAPIFGGGEVLDPGVYYIFSAANIAGQLTLDGGGDPDARFVIKANGALTIDAGAEIILTGEARSCNVFFLINGAITAAAGAIIKGTLFSKAGAVGLAANCVLEGRMLTMGGAITMALGAVASPPPCATTIQVFCESGCDPAPAVDVLGVLKDFTLFTKAGAVGNTAISGVNGGIGTNAGTIANYAAGIHIGNEHIANALTGQASADLDLAFAALTALAATNVAHPAAFADETITPGVYAISTAGSVGGTVILDAEGNEDAIFVFRFGGALNIAALTKMVLINGAKRCNIFWLGGVGVATGAVNIGAFSEVKGYFIANNAASNSGGGVFLAGGQFSTGGAVNTDSGIFYDNPECITSSPLSPNPACALVKTASIGGTGTGLEGEVITYTFTVTNIGPAALPMVNVTDGLAGLVISGGPIVSLEIGVSNSDITGTYTITAADVATGSVTNTATATDANGVTDISGTANDNDDATVTNFATPSDPCDPDPAVGLCDQDGDGLTNDEEVTAGTDPTIADTDGDGINDGDEFNGLDGDPLTMGDNTNPVDACDPTQSPGYAAFDAANAIWAAADCDNDGFTNRDEYAVGSDPYEPCSLSDDCPTILPVELTSFTGRTAGKPNILEWTVASEEAFSYYELERSPGDAANWEFLGAVAGAGQVGHAQAYTYTDVTPPNSVYYRLRMADRDGSFAYSNIVYLEQATPAGELVVYPNPNNGQFTVQLPTDESASLTLYDLNGRTVWQRKATSEVSIASLPDGLYLLSATTASNRWTKRIVVR